MSAGTRMVQRYNWPIVIFFSIVMSVALVGAPLYVRRFGISAGEILLTLFFVIATGMSITVGYHRLYAHATFKANKVIRFLILFFGAAAFEQSALTWSSGHRDHHRYVDTDRDPYSIKKGFWYAHIGWMTLWQQEPDYRNAKDLLNDRLVMHQHRHYIAWSAIAGIALPVLIGALLGHALGAFVLAVCARLTFVYHATFCINSVCHTIGKATYDIHATARDHWFVALLTNGEGYHNFHHRFPTDYRNGVRWYHWDPSKWAIALLARMGLARDLRRVSKFSIFEARLAAENQLMRERLMQIQDHLWLARMKEALHLRHTALVQHLLAWEASAKSYQALVSKQMADYSDELKTVTWEKVQIAKADFKNARRQWKTFARSWMLDPHYAYAALCPEEAR